MEKPSVFRIWQCIIELYQMRILTIGCRDLKAGMSKAMLQFTDCDGKQYPRPNNSSSSAEPNRGEDESRIKKKGDDSMKKKKDESRGFVSADPSATNPNFLAVTHCQLMIFFLFNCVSKSWLAQNTIQSSLIFKKKYNFVKHLKEKSIDRF